MYSIMRKVVSFVSDSGSTVWISLVEIGGKSEIWGYIKYY